MSEGSDRVLVAAGSKHGSTAEIAQRIGSVLTEEGVAVDVLEPGRVGDPSAYRAVILGSAVYAGDWVSSARDLAERIARLTSQPDIWLFSSGPVGDPPKPADAPLDILDIEEKTRARDHRVFSGKIDKSRLSFGEKAIMAAVRAQEGDFREWAEIEAWAKEIADSVGRKVMQR